MSTTGRIYAGAALCLAVLLAVLMLVDRVGTASESGRAVDVLALEPSDGTIMPDLPTRVLIRVAGEPDPSRSHIAVYDAARIRLDMGPIVLDGNDGLRQEVVVSGPGQLAVAYHVVTVDGRSTSGIARFTVGAPGAAAPAAPPGAADSSVHAHGVDPVGAALLALDGIVLLAVLVLLLRGPHRGTA